MIRDGTIDGKPLELFDGWIVEKMPKNAPHDSAIFRLQRRLTKLLGDEFLVRIQYQQVLIHFVSGDTINIFHTIEFIE